MSLPTTSVSNVPIQAQPIDRAGYFSIPWIHFFQFLYSRIGGSSAPSNTALADAIAGGNTGPIVPITVSASPFVYTASSAGSVILSGGSIENVEFERPPAGFISVGSFRGAVPMGQNDQLRVTYTAGQPPTMTFVPI